MSIKYHMGKAQGRLFTIFSLILMIIGAVTEVQAQEPGVCLGDTCFVTPTVMPLQPRQSSEDLVITQKAVDARGSTLNTANSPAYIGNFVTYTIVISNISNRVIKGLSIASVLPRDAFDKWNFTKCSDFNNCVLTPATPSETSTPPRQISWTLNQLEPNTSVTYTFGGRIVCQADQTILNNAVFVSYEGVNQSSLHQIMVQAGSAALGDLEMVGPTWCSFGAERSMDLDWGDFDMDGDLDLALATNKGTFVYKNTKGILEQFWHDELPSSGVQWAQISTSYFGLELVTGGSSNLIYYWAGVEFSQFSQFTTDSLYRVAVADYNGDSFMDIAGLSQDSLCLTRLYLNDGFGKFNNDGCILTQKQSSDGAETLVWGDYNGNGPDLAIISYETDDDGVTGSSLNLLTNDGQGNFGTAIQLGRFDGNVYALSWGDYDGNGFLDLAVPVYSNDEVWVYWNNNGKFISTDYTIIPDVSKAAAVEGADFDHDGRLDLAVAGDNDEGYLQIFTFYGGEFVSLDDPYSTAQRLVSVWTMRSADMDNDGDIDIAIANGGQSVLFSNLGIFLSRKLQLLDDKPTSANSVAWGDFDSDKDLDLVFGASSDNNALGTTLYENRQGKFSLLRDFPGLGPREIAFGDYDNDGLLDVATVDTSRTQVFVRDTNAPIISENLTGGRAVAWGDANDDGNLDLLVGADGYNQIIFNPKDTFIPYTIVTKYNARGVAWGDYNRDRYLDFAVVSDNGPTQVYCNNRNNTFTLAWQSSLTVTGRAVAWADYDNDGDLDLTEGSLGSGFSLIRLYDNSVCDTQSCNSRLPFETRQVTCDTKDVFSNANARSVGSFASLTGLAWADADNDSDLDLAVGAEGQPDVIFFLAKRGNGQYGFYANWISPEAYPTTGVAWGDADGDGDLDLAVSGRGGYSGIYMNYYNNIKKTTPNQPPVVTIERPGITNAAYFYAVGKDFVSGAANPTVTVRYKVFDVDNDAIITTSYQYSLNGGTNWLSATPATTPTAIVSSNLLGKDLTFLWNAQADQAISDNAIFRILVESAIGSVGVDRNSPYRTGFNQRATTAGMSPPFRVRGTTCVWPETPTLTWYNASGVEKPSKLTISDTITFQGRVSTGSKGLTFNWYFGSNPTPVQGQVIRRKFDVAQLYPITLRVTSDSCPIAKSVSNNQYSIYIQGRPLTFLPVLLRNGIGYATPTRTPLPDVRPNLVTSFILEPSQPQLGQPVTISVIVSNFGSAAVTEPFYVDFYINPTKEPTIAIPWYEMQATNNDFGGLEWYIEDPLEVDGSILLTSNGSKDGLSPNGFTQWSGYFTSKEVIDSLQLYAYADSDGRGNPNGVIFESDEHDNSYHVEVPLAAGRPLMATPLPQISDFTGEITATGTHLSWSQANEPITGYRLYRLGLEQTGPFQLIATLPATQTDYVDVARTCGQMYYVTTFNDTEESDASLMSYISPPCPMTD